MYKDYFPMLLITIVELSLSEFEEDTKHHFICMLPAQRSYLQAYNFKFCITLNNIILYYLSVSEMFGYAIFLC